MSSNEGDGQLKHSKKAIDDNTAKFISYLCEEGEDEDVDDDEFYFETDFLALKGNSDYLRLIKALTVLEVQRIRICQDIEKLEKLRGRVWEDPERVKSEILSGEASYLKHFEIEKIPEIDWAKYKNIDFDRIKTLTTRRMAKNNFKQDPVDEKSDFKKDEKGTIRVRGRIFTENKPETYNQLWTVEEQLRLEQLLIEFPPEPVESRRWKKIADALGNRTTKQVCSRVQKYFKKLQKAGIAVPGRPKKFRSTKPAMIHRRHKHYLYKPSTFFPGVAMSELGESDSEEGSCVSGESIETDPSQWIEILTQIKEEKEKPTKELAKHFGFKCISCGENPIAGMRWGCKSCPKVILCSDCIVSIPDSENPVHPVTHQYKTFKALRNPVYIGDSLGISNYLDPNFTDT